MEEMGMEMEKEVRELEGIYRCLGVRGWVHALWWLGTFNLTLLPFAII